MPSTHLTAQKEQKTRSEGPLPNRESLPERKKSIPDTGNHFLGIKNESPTRETVFGVQKMRSRPGRAFPEPREAVPTREDICQEAET